VRSWFFRTYSLLKRGSNGFSALSLLCCLFGEFFMRFYLEIAGETGTMASARNIAGYILSKKAERLTFGILTRDCWPCRGRSRDEVIHMLEPLEMFGWLIPDDPIVPRAWTVRPHCVRDDEFLHEAVDAKGRLFWNVLRRRL